MCLTTFGQAGSFKNNVREEIGMGHIVFDKKNTNERNLALISDPKSIARSIHKSTFYESKTLSLTSTSKIPETSLFSFMFKTKVCIKVER